LFGLAGVRVERVERLADGTRMVQVVTAHAGAATCPTCGAVSRSVKERTATSQKDIPYGENGILVRWCKTRWRCQQGSCEVGSFTESIPEVPPRARTTRRLRAQIGSAIGNAARSVSEVAAAHQVVVADRAPRLHRTRRSAAGRAGTGAGVGDRRDPPWQTQMGVPHRNAAVGAGGSVGHRVRRSGRRAGADQSPISTVNASPVSAEKPRRHPSRFTGSVNRGEVATSAIRSSRRSRAAVADRTASK
jgi:hypothetical protein